MVGFLWVFGSLAVHFLCFFGGREGGLFWWVAVISVSFLNVFCKSSVVKRLVKDELPSINDDFCGSALSA